MQLLGGDVLITPGCTSSMRRKVSVPLIMRAKNMMKKFGICRCLNVDEFYSWQEIGECAESKTSLAF